MSHQNPADAEITQPRRGSVDPVMARQLASDQFCFRVIGELRYLLDACAGKGTWEEHWREMTERAAFTLQDPRLLDKVTAQRLLNEIYREAPRNPEMAGWLVQKFAEMDPDRPEWLIMRDRARDKAADVMADLAHPGSPSACMLFLELCHECDKHDKSLDLLMEKAGPAVVEMAMNAPPVPPPSMAARKRHMKNLEERPDYRQEMASFLGKLKETTAKDPRIAQAIQESLKMTRFIGFPADSTAKEDFAVMQEEVDALLHAMKTGEINPHKKPH